MDPNIGKFYPIDDSSKPKKNSISTFQAKEKNWPIFEIGETIMLKDYPFEILHIKYSSGRMVLRPVPTKKL